MLQDASAIFHAGRFTNRFHRNHDRESLSLRDLLKINVKDRARQSVVLDFLYQRQTFGLGIFFNA